jgi:hypothetical protein
MRKASDLSQSTDAQHRRTIAKDMRYLANDLADRKQHDQGFGRCLGAYFLLVARQENCHSAEYWLRATQIERRTASIYWWLGERDGEQ